MCATELALADDVFQVGRQAVAAENAGERGAQDGRQHVGTAGRGNAVHHEGAGDERPQPPFLAVGPVAGLVGIEHRLLPQRRFRSRRPSRKQPLTDFPASPANGRIPRSPGKRPNNRCYVRVLAAS